MLRSKAASKPLLALVVLAAAPAARAQQACIDYGAHIHALGNVAAPGLAQDVVVNGTLAFVVGGIGGLAIFDVTDPTAPVLLSSVDIPGTNARGVAVAGTHAYVIDFNEGLYVVDVSAPLSPVIVGNTPLLGGRRVVVAGNHAYVASSIFRIVDISNPAAPAIVGSLQMSVPIQDVAVTGNEAYLAAYSQGLIVVDVSIKSAPAVLGGLDTPDFAFEVAVAGSYAYLANRDAGLQILDVANPAVPVAVGSADIVAFAVTVADNIAYVGSDVTVVTVDITNPVAPATVGGAMFADGARAIAKSGDYLFLANATLGLGVAVVESPAWPSIAGSYDTGGFGMDVTLAGEHLYVAGSSFPLLANAPGLLLLDVAAPATPALLGSVSLTGTPFDTAVAGDLIYVSVHGTGLQVVDASIPTSPIVIGTATGLPTVYDVHGVAVAGSHVYLAAGAAGLHVIDVSTATAPVHAGSVDTPGTATSVVVAGTYAFVADGSSGVQVVDVSNPAVPSIVANSPGASTELTKVGDHVFTISWNGVQVIDVSNPLAPAVLGATATTGYEELAIGGAVAYVAGSILEAFDVSDFEAPAFVGAVGPVGTARGIAVGAQHVYVLDEGRIIVFPAHCTLPTDSPATGAGFLATTTLQAWPNPARGQVELRFNLSRSGDVRLEVFDVAGRRVREVLRGRAAAGRSTIGWDGRDDRGRRVPAATYFVRLSDAAGASSERVTLLR